MGVDTSMADRGAKRRVGVFSFREPALAGPEDARIHVKTVVVARHTRASNGRISKVQIAR